MAHCTKNETAAEWSLQHSLVEGHKVPEDYEFQETITEAVIIIFHTQNSTYKLTKIALSRGTKTKLPVLLAPASEQITAVQAGMSEVLL